MFQNAFKVALLVGVAWAATASAPAIGDGMTYPDFESQWRSPTAGRGGIPWDPTKPMGLGQAGAADTGVSSHLGSEPAGSGQGWTGQQL